MMMMMMMMVMVLKTRIKQRVNSQCGFRQLIQSNVPFTGKFSQDYFVRQTGRVSL
jgi:hypothetical protein